MGLDTFALASDDGSVTVRQLKVSEKWGSFIFDDVSNQSITSENRHYLIHTEKAIS
jgi:hypothetical protein